MTAEPPPDAWAAALAGLPGMGPVRLRALLAAHGAPGAWRAVVAGRAAHRADVAAAMGRDPAALGNRWRTAAASIDPGALWAECRRAGMGVAMLGGLAYPPRLADDPDPPAVLFYRGDPTALRAQPVVAVVGTRSATAYGTGIAARLGRDLRDAGCAVVSGLALGIDAGAHSGALAGSGPAPVAVVANAVDHPYPRRNRELWAAVAACGVVVGEAPPGTPIERWRFPARNRIVAGLADAVVVVESAARGGSMHTVEAALARDRPVLAVPGPVTSPASAGTNKLLAEGASVCRDADDVLLAIGRTGAGSAERADRAGVEDPLLAAFAWQPCTVDELVARTGRTPADVGLALRRLEQAGEVGRTGAFWERRLALDRH